jgi:mitochondrial fission protein ELM1
MKHLVQEPLVGTLLLSLFFLSWNNDNEKPDAATQIVSRTYKYKTLSLYKKIQIIYSAFFEQWNKLYSIGTKVTSDFYDMNLETRTDLMPLFRQRAAVYVKGYNGYFDLRQVTAVR